MSVQVSARISNQMKQDFERICDSVGLTAAGALNVFICSVIRHNGIPFELKAENEITSYEKEKRAKRIVSSLENLNAGNTINLTADEVLNFE